MSSTAPEVSTPFDGLGPELILDAVEAAGFECDGHLLALNSYENRVYRVGVEDGAPVVVKFYRPGRWSDEAIGEEHGFALELAALEIPVAAPLARPGGGTLLSHEDYRYAVFPMHAGRWPELASAGARRRMGRYLGRIHLVGASAPFRHRPALDLTTFGEVPRARVLASPLLAPEHALAYEEVSGELLAAVRQRLGASEGVEGIRLHGDCHAGNVLWSDSGPTFVDLDDSRTGPAIQDLWMMLSGEPDEMSGQLGDLLDGYEDFRTMDRREVALIEALRALRLVHYAGWLAARWDDPAFPPSFPWFATSAYWADHLSALRQQISAVREPPMGNGDMFI